MVANECLRVPMGNECHRVPPSATQLTNVVEWRMPSAIIARLVGEGRIRPRDR